MVGIAGGAHLVSFAQGLELGHMLLGHIGFIVLHRMDNICLFFGLVIIELMSRPTVALADLHPLIEFPSPFREVRYLMSDNTYIGHLFHLH